MPSFGEKLKQEREKRQITLEQISISTKIGTRMLQALEEDKFNQLPGGIFNKGFVRAYSRVVGLDEDQTVAEYLQASGDAPPVRTELVGHETDGQENEAREGNNNNEESVRRLEASADASARPLPWGWFAAVLLVVALALSFWSHREREHAREAVAPTLTTVAPPPDAASGGLSGEANGAVSNNSTGPATATSPANESPKAVLPTAKAAPSDTPKTSQDLTAAVPAAAPGEFTLVIQAREESWMSITADGRSIPSELLLAGSERTVRGRKAIVVRAGNAGAVDFLLNGKKLGTGGDYGEVKTLTFGPGGILPNATAPSTP